MIGVAPEPDAEELASALVSLQDRVVELCGLAGAAAGILDPVKAADACIRNAGPLVGASSAAAVLVFGGDVAIAGADAEAVFDPHLALGYAPAERAEVLEPAHLAGVDCDRPALVVPLRAADPAGVVLLWGRDVRTDAPARRLAEAVSAQTAAAVRAAAMHQRALAAARVERDYELAADLVAGLSPSIPRRIGELPSSGRVLPAGRAGGDFLEIRVDEGATSLIAGDVAGKGLPAAVLAAKTLAASRAAAAALPGIGAGDLLAAIGKAIDPDLDRLRLLTTLVTARLDHRLGLLTVANAGHSPVVLRPSGGPARLLRPDVPPAGVLDRTRSRELTLGFRPGDLFVVASDGIVEQRSPAGDQFGLLRLFEILERLQAETPETILEVVFEAVETHAADAPVEDDRMLAAVGGRG